MKAWVLDQPAPVESRPLSLADVPVPQLADDEVLVKVNACGICRTDLHVVEGELSIRKSRVIPGHPVVGTISAVGSRVDDFKIGDRVGIAWLNRTCAFASSALAGKRSFATELCSPDGLLTVAMPNSPSLRRLSRIISQPALMMYKQRRSCVPASSVIDVCGKPVSKRVIGAESGLPASEPLGRRDITNGQLSRSCDLRLRSVDGAAKGAAPCVVIDRLGGRQRKTTGNHLQRVNHVAR